MARKLSLVQSFSSSHTVTLMVVLPEASALGVAVRVRLAPLPPSVRLASGSSVWFDDVAVTDRSPAGVSASFTVKASGPKVVSSSSVWFGMSLMVGRSLVGLTVMEKVSSAAAAL